MTSFTKIAMTSFTKMMTATRAVVAVALFLGGAGPAVAQDSAPLDTERIESLIEMIEDEEEREAFLERLRTLSQAELAPAPEPTGMAAVLDDLSARLGATEAALAAVIGDGDGLSGVGTWLTRQVGTAEGRDFWLSLLAKVVLAVAAGLVVRWLVRAALTAPRRSFERREVPSPWLRAPILVAHGLLELVPVAAFYGAALLALALVQPEPAARLVALAIVHAIALATAVRAVARLLLRPTLPAMRLVALRDEDAAYAFVWVRRLLAIPIYGYFLAEALEALGMPAAGLDALIKVAGLAEAGLVLVFILQNRRSVAAWIRGDGVTVIRGVQVLRDRLAEVWHILAITYLLATYVVWALGVQGGFAFIARATALSVLVLALARLALMLVRRGAERHLAIGEALTARFPHLKARANAYIAGVRKVFEGAIYVVAALLIAQAWSIAIFDWLGGEIGRRLLGSALEIAVVVLIAAMAWEVSSSFITRYLEGHTAPDGGRVERSARARTLLPLVRNALLVVIATVATLSVLSSLGINIAPLLAGAGVIGLAIGFGAQTLVKDVITGAFILFEDQVQVGDVAIINGQGGLVEKLTVRTIVLRDLAGNVHIVPFSAVGTLTNMTKEYSRYVLDVGVAYREDTDQVVEVLRAIDAEMRADPEYASKMIAPIDILGVDRFEDSAVIVRARLTTKPIEQWSVGREFNRRMKKRFDELGIEIPFPHQTVYFGVDKQGMAPGARISLESPEAAAPTARLKSDTTGSI